MLPRLFSPPLFKKLSSPDSRPQSANNRPRLLAPRACHFTTGVLIDCSRIIYRSGFHLGSASLEGLRFRSRPDTRKKTELFPKLNRMTHPPHSVKVETQVMQGI